MYELTKKDLVLNGELIHTWAPDYEEFDVDLDDTIQQGLVIYDGNYYIVEINTNTNDAVFPDESALVLDMQYERMNNTFIWNQIQEHIPDEDLETWDDEPFDNEDWDWENDIE